MSNMLQNKSAGCHGVMDNNLLIIVWNQTLLIVAMTKATLMVRCKI
jgi:hypothetical protein